MIDIIPLINALDDYEYITGFRLDFIDRCNRINKLTQLCGEGEKLYNQMNSESYMPLNFEDLGEEPLRGEMVMNYFIPLLDEHVKNCNLCK